MFLCFVTPKMATVSAGHGSLCTKSRMTPVLFQTDDHLSFTGIECNMHQLPAQSFFALNLAGGLSRYASGN